MTNKQKILDISKRLGLTHIGSNLSCLPVLEGIYAMRKPGDIVILDNAHAHLAHLVVRGDDMIYDEFGPIMPGESIEGKMKRYGIHCDRKAGCDASGGSLGHGIGIGIGYALANPGREVYVIVSDGSMMEGSNWEALRIIESLFHDGTELSNLHLFANFNGYTALAAIDRDLLKEKMEQFCPLDITFHYTKNGEGFEGVAGHYKKL